MSTVEGFGLKFQEAIDFLKGKIPAPTLAWDDLAGPVHAKVFAVAGATKADLVNDIHTAVTKAIEQGETITQFRKDFDKAVSTHGWTYKGKRGWRSRVIYQTNMRAAHMAGRWKQLQANKAFRPYIQYRTAGDARVRPLHRAWDGMVFHIDHPFWDTHYPPNGWLCRCTVRSLGASDVDERNLPIEEKSPTEKSRWVVNKDGELTDLVPIGIDPGWDHNVGKSWIAPEVALGQKLARLPIFLRGQMAQKTIVPAFQSVIETNFKGFQENLKADVLTRTRTLSTGEIETYIVPVARGNVQVLGYLDSAVIFALETHVPDLEMRSTLLLHRDANQLHIEGAHKQAGQRRGGAPQQIWPAEFINQLPKHLADYQAIVWDVDSQAILVVPSGRFNETVPTAAFKQRHTKLGDAWELKGLGSKDFATLRNAKKYLLLAGKL